jgi:hypothetical protein
MIRPSGPVAIDDLLKKQKEAKDVASRPVFVSKKERERSAQETADKAKAAVQVQRPQPGPSSHAAPPTGPKGMRGSPLARTGTTFKRAHDEVDRPPVPDTNGAPVIDQSLIRSRYLGGQDKKRKIRKQSDKKFVFDWDKADDTGAADEQDTFGGAKAQTQPNVPPPPPPRPALEMFVCFHVEPLRLTPWTATTCRWLAQPWPKA